MLDEASIQECLKEIDEVMALKREKMLENDDEENMSKFGLYRRAYRLMLQNSVKIKSAKSTEEKMNILLADSILKSSIEFATLDFKVGSSRMLSEARKIMNS